MAYTIKIEVTVPDSFDPMDDAWEVEKAAQEFVDNNYPEEFKDEEEAD